MEEPGGPGAFTFQAELMIKSLFQDPGGALGVSGWSQLGCTQDSPPKGRALSKRPLPPADRAALGQGLPLWKMGVVTAAHP